MSLGKRTNPSILFLEVASLQNLMSAKSFSTSGSQHSTVSITCLSSLCFFSGTMETLIQSCVDGHGVRPLLMNKEDADSPLSDVEQFSNSIAVCSSCAGTKESRNFLGVEDGEIGIGYIPLLGSLK